MVCRCQLPAAGGEPSPAEGYGPTVTSKCRVASPVSLVQPHHSTARAPGFEMLKSTGTIGFTWRSQIAPLPGHSCVFMHAWLLLGWHSKNTPRMNKSGGTLGGTTIQHR